MEATRAEAVLSLVNHLLERCVYWEQANHVYQNGALRIRQELNPIQWAIAINAQKTS